MNWLELAVYKSEHLTQALANIPLNREWYELSWEELILKILPSWNEKGIKLLRKKVWYYISIMSLCGKPILLKEILEAIGYSNRIAFTNSYIKPLRECGLITLTNPNKPTASDNKYVITPKGKEFLAGQ